MAGENPGAGVFRTQGGQRERNPMLNSLDLATVEAAYFEPLLHEKFSAKLWNENSEPVFLDFELVRVAPYLKHGIPDRRPSFSLYFNGPPGASLEQGTYDLHHAATGEFALFLVPVESKGDHLLFEAVLN